MVSTFGTKNGGQGAMGLERTSGEGFCRKGFWCQTGLSLPLGWFWAYTTLPSWMAPLSINNLWYICFFSAQFIDGRLDLLNSGEGFSDVFEEEINMGEYAGKKLPVALFFQER